MGQAMVFRAQILPAELELYWPVGTGPQKPWTETELGSGIILSDPLSTAAAGMDAAFWQVNAQPLAHWCIKKPKVKNTVLADKQSNGGMLQLFCKPILQELEIHNEALKSHGNLNSSSFVALQSLHQQQP